MKDIGIVRNIDEMGRLVIPKEMRRKMDIETGDEIEFFIEGDRIVLRKYQPSCLFCGNTEDNVLFDNKRICRACLDKLKEL